MDQNENIFDAFNEDEDDTFKSKEKLVGKKHKREQPITSASLMKKQKLR